MRILIQRVRNASVAIGGRTHSSIGEGLLVLLGIEEAVPLYEAFVADVAAAVGRERVRTGVFGADMQVELTNDGPVTIWIDSKNRE